MKYYLGLDWGEKKIGVAFGEDETSQAFGYGVLPNSKEIYKKLNDLIVEYKVEKVVLGIQKNEFQNDNSIKIEKFGKKLAEFSGKEVVFSEEMFTTREAQNNLKQTNKKSISKKDDAESARIILQNFLDL